MPARTVAQRIVGLGRDHKTRLYYVAGVCLLVVAAGLRFHDLAENPVREDEAITAHISSGALSEVVRGTGCCSSSPILYPLVLYAVQQVESTPFSVRVVPATASLLTVALILLWLPRLGVARGAALLAALLAAISVEAIRHAQDAREYSVDALVALVMVAALFRYLREGKKALLCASLFLAPLVQYGLVLFGVAVIGAAIVAPRVSGPERRSARLGRIGDWLDQRLDLVAPGGFFLAGSVVSYLATLRDQWQQGGFASDAYLLTYYYQGNLDAHSILDVCEFAIDGIWRLLTYHLPDVVAVATLPALVILLVASLLGKFQGKVVRGKLHDQLDGKLQDSAIAVVFSFCIAVSIGAAVLGIYPLGDIRQGIYLGPMIFLAVGVAFHWLAGYVAALTRRRWAMPAFVVAIAGVTGLAGIGDMLQDSPYETPRNTKSVLALLKERVREEDLVFLGSGTGYTIRFHLGRQRPVNYYYTTSGQCTEDSTRLRQCLREMADLTYWLGINRVWFVVRKGPAVFRRSLPGLSVQQVVSSGITELYLIEDTESLAKIAAGTGTLEKMAPTLLGAAPDLLAPAHTFDVYVSDDMLIYVKDPCGPEDLRAAFFLHVYPADAKEGLENLDFRFEASGVRSADRCVVLRELPGYDFARIHTGQYDDGGRLWEGEHKFAAAPGNGEPNRLGALGDVPRLHRHPPALQVDVESAGVAPVSSDLAVRCGKFLKTHPYKRNHPRWAPARQAWDDCQAAREAWFSEKPAAAPIIPAAAPTSWGEVFADVPQRLERALPAIRDPGCRVPEGEIRADLAEQCAARDMAVLAVFKNACGWARDEFEPLLDFDARFGLQEYLWLALWGDYVRALRRLDDGWRFAGELLELERPARVEAAWNERLLNVEEHRRQRWRLEQVHLRTGWLLLKCRAEKPTLLRMARRSTMFAGLMARAAALGDELALADRPAGRRRAQMLEKSDPVLAWLHLAVLDSEAAGAERDEAWERAWRELADRSPHFENRRRLLGLAGVECAEPCTREKLRARETESREHRVAFNREASEDCAGHDDCDLEGTIAALRKTLRDAEMAPERRETYWRIGMRYRKQRESVRVKYALAMEALAEATGRAVDVQALRQQIADPSLPWFLDDSEVELARAEARRLVADALSSEASAAIDQAGANQRAR